MRTQDAKKIPMRELLARLGCEPASEKSGDVWYVSPFRPQEQKPSFHVRERDNVWYDFGLGSGGNVLDFVMQYFGLRDVPNALRKLDDMSGWQRVEPVGQGAAVRARPAAALAASAGSEASRMQTVKVQPLQHFGLLDYVKKRGIDVAVARIYLQEIYYTARPNQEKPYFALAFPNRMANGSEGYELRSAYFQGVQGQKDLSVIPPSQQEQTSAVRVFEGFMDFLSWLTWTGQRRPDSAVIVLNSVSLGERAIALIREMGCSEVRLCLDHDTAGRELTAKFEQELADRHIVDDSMQYKGHKDFNAFLQDKGQMRLAL